MSSQADVRSIEALNDFRVAMALFAEDTLGALGAVDMEIKRTVQWLQHDRKAYWAEQIKRREQAVAAAKAEVFRRQLAKTTHSTPAQSEQKEQLRRAEASLRDAEMRSDLVKKWEPALQQALLEYHASTRRIKDLAAGDVPRATALLERMVLALEGYVNATGPAGAGEASRLESITERLLNEDEAAAVKVEKVEEPAAVDDAAPGPAPGISEDSSIS